MRLSILAMVFAGCFSPIQSADTNLVPVVRGAADAGSSRLDAGSGGGASGIDAGGGSAIDAGPSSDGGLLTSSGIVIPPAPITTIVDVSAPNPELAFVESSQTTLDGGCRGDDFLRGVAKPVCSGRQCLVSIDSSRLARVIASGDGFSVKASTPSRLAYVRSERPSRLVISDGMATLGELPISGQVEVRFDGNEPVLFAMSRSQVTVSRGTLAIATIPGQLSTQVPPVVDQNGRAWVVTDAGLFRTAPRDGTGFATVRLIGAPTTLSTFAPLAGGQVLLGLGSSVWLSDGENDLVELAHFGELRVSAVKQYRTGFAAIVSGEVYYSEAGSPLRKVLSRHPNNPYATTEDALEVHERMLLVSTACISWSSYPGYDVAVIDPQFSSAAWWWDVYASQFEVPAFPVSRANVAGPTWGSVEVRRGPLGFITSMAP